MFNRRLESRLKNSSLSASSAKRRGCGMIPAPKGRRSTVMNDVRNVQNSINLLNNLVTSKRASHAQPASRDVLNKMPGANPSLSVSSDNNVSDPCDPLVKLVPFIDPVLPYRTSSPCRSNFRTLSTITQFRRSVSLNRVNMAQSLSSLNMSDSMFSLTDIRPPPREERPTKLSPSTFVSKDPDIRPHLDSKPPTWATSDPLDTVSLPDQLVTKPRPALSSTVSTTSNHGSPRYNRRRLFNRKIAGSVTDSLPTSMSSYDTHPTGEEEEIEKVCIERWLCGLPGDSSSEGKSLGVSIRGLDEEDEGDCSSRPTAPHSSERSFSEDGYLCNCEFGGSHECCIFHNTSLGSAATSLPQRSFIDGVTSTSTTSHSGDNHTNPSQRLEEHSRVRHGNNIKRDQLTISDAADITGLISAIDLGFNATEDPSTCHDVNNYELEGTSSTRCHDFQPTNNHETADATVWNHSGMRENDLIGAKAVNEPATYVRDLDSHTSETRLTTELEYSESSGTSSTLITCVPAPLLSESALTTENQVPTTPSDDSDISSKTHDDKPSSEPGAISQNVKHLSVPCNLGEVPNVRSPCGEDFDKLSEDSFYTESDSNSLIGGIIRSMVGV